MNITLDILNANKDNIYFVSKLKRKGEVEPYTSKENSSNCGVLLSFSSKLKHYIAIKLESQIFLIEEKLDTFIVSQFPDNQNLFNVEKISQFDIDLSKISFKPKIVFTPCNEFPETLFEMCIETDYLPTFNVQFAKYSKSKVY